MTRPPAALAPGQAAALPPALLEDMARMFRQLGIESFRATVVDVDSMAFQAAWTITCTGEVSDDPPGRPLDSAFPGAVATATLLGHAELDETLTQKLSPRRWVFAWRLDDQHGVIAEARYRDARGAVSELDQALARLVCDTGIRAGLYGTPGEPPPDAALVWPQVERRSAARRPADRSAYLLPALVGAALLATWGAVAVLPRASEALALQQADATRLRAMADSTVAKGLAAALATGDYGEVQTALTGFAGLGYFKSAVVTNARERVVSLVDTGGEVRIGAAVPATLQNAARQVPLVMGSERYGQLLLLDTPTHPPPAIQAGTLHLASLALAGVATVLTTLGAGLLAWRWLRRSRRAG